MTDCLDDEAIANLSAGVLDDDERAALTEHIDVCDACRTLVAEASRGGAPDEPASRMPLLAGATLGRYIILETVGAGAMGVVYAAYDPELGRKVALKVLRTDPFANVPSGLQRTRLLREAQSLAKLAHPNVITLHDIGVIDGEVFLAMELVESGTLGDWLRASERPWPAVLAMMRQAGDGLAAAHAVGLVHRDFKPENVLVGAEGRPRVTDFGLAREQPVGEAAPRSTPDAASLDGDSKLTLTGALLGTPAYMAPELLTGSVADARSDQFSFASTLYEALYGERPFEGGDVGSLAHRVAGGAVRPAPSKTRVPLRVRRVVLRGLSANPDERFPSLRTMLDALAKGPILSPARLTIGLFGCAVLALGAALALSARRAPVASAVCTGDDAAWGDVFGDAARAGIRRAFTSTGLPSADASFSAVEGGLDAYRNAWTTAHHQACAATRVERSQSEAVLDRRMVCLESRRREAAALVSVLATADEKTVADAEGAVDALPSVASCAESEELLALDPPPKEPEKRAELSRIDGEAMRAIALERASRWSECATTVAEIQPKARELAYRPLEARVALAAGMCGIHMIAGKEALNEAARIAIAAHDDVTLADAWTALVRASFYDRSSEGEMWATYAEVAIARLGGDDVREVNRLIWLAMNLQVTGSRLEEAEGYARHGYELAKKTFGDGDYRVITPKEILANVLMAEDRMDEALLLHREVIAARARALGDDSPALFVSLANEGQDLDFMGHPGEALAIYRRALAKWKSSVWIRNAHDLAGQALRHQGQFADALVEDQAALAAATEPADRAQPLAGIGLDQLGLGHPREAIRFLEPAVTDAYRAEDFTEDALYGLAQALWDSGGDKNRARECAIKLREKLVERAHTFGGRFRKQLDSVDAWLDRHRVSDAPTGSSPTTAAR